MERKCIGSGGQPLKKIDIHVHSLLKKGIERPRAGGTFAAPFIAYYKSQGARGVGEVTANPYFDDPLVLNLFYHCEKCAMPLTFHIGNKGRDYGLIDEIGLPRLEKVLGLYPNRLYFGTDICDPRNISNPMLKLSAWLDDAAASGRISRQAYEKVCRANAANLLGRPMIETGKPE